jgi:simple sugar transport system ATP-binding protein
LSCSLRIKFVSDISFSIRAGEILAVAGVQGNGQSELAEAIIGLQDHVDGKITLAGEDISKFSVRKALHAGIAFVPESREEDGLISSFSIEENLILDLHDLPPFAKGPVISQSVVSENGASRVTEFDIRAQSPKDSASSLSGGNKQKVVLARELSAEQISLLIVANPCFGLDFKAVDFIHRALVEARNRGVAVLLVSEDLDELIKLSDRIFVMSDGQLVYESPTSAADITAIGQKMAGH